MRIALRFTLLLLLAPPMMLLAQDKTQEAVNQLNNRDTTTYDRAVSYLAKHPREAEAPLRALLTDYASASPIARLRAAMLLGDFGGPGAKEDLKTALTSGKESNAAVRAEIIGSLGRLGSKDVVVDYYNSGSEKSPSATAAIALALQGSTDDKSKLALAHLLASSDERVYKATFLAVEKSYEPVLDSQANASGKKFNFAEVFLEAKNQVKGTDHPDLTFSSSPDWSSEWKQPTPGDKAIFAALKGRVKVNYANTDTDKDAQALLLVLSQFYKQTENP